MGGHALRGAVTAWLSLIALQAIGTQGGSGRIASFFGDVDNLVKRALDPTVPAIRDRRGPAGTTDGNGNFHPTVPDWLGGGTTTAPGSGTSGQRSNPNIVPYDPPPIGQSNPAYGGQGGLVSD
jgi:hypothetical protein